MKKQVIYDTNTGVILSITTSKKEVQDAYNREMDGEDITVTNHVDNQKVGDVLKGYMELKQTLSDFKPLSKFNEACESILEALHSNKFSIL